MHRSRQHRDRLPSPQRFWLVRHCDASGVSGTGLVAEGVRFSSGKVVLNWLRPPGSLGIFMSLADLLAVHGHQGQTQIEWLDEMESSVLYLEKE